MDITTKFEDKDSALHWFLISSLTGVEITDNLKACPRLLTMQLNGEELNPLNAIERLETQFDELVKKEAEKLFENMKEEILTPFQDKVEELTDCVKLLIENKCIDKST